MYRTEEVIYLALCTHAVRRNAVVKFGAEQIESLRILAVNGYFVRNEAENECRQKCINSFNFSNMFRFYLLFT